MRRYFEDHFLDKVFGPSLESIMDDLGLGQVRT